MKHFAIVEQDVYGENIAYHVMNNTSMSTFVKMWTDEISYDPGTISNVSMFTKHDLAAAHFTQL